MAAVIRPADARLSASTMIMSSISVSLLGVQVDCSTNTSLPRTFSWISTMISPSEKRLTIALPSEISRILTTSCASAGFALPVKTIRPSLFIVYVRSVGLKAKRGKVSQEKTVLLARASLSRPPRQDRRSMESRGIRAESAAS